MTLINASLYPSCRLAIHKSGAVPAVMRVISAPQADEVRKELALALMQNLSLTPQTHGEIIESGFIEALRHFLGGACFVEGAVGAEVGVEVEVGVWFGVGL